MGGICCEEKKILEGIETDDKVVIIIGSLELEEGW